MGLLPSLAEGRLSAGHASYIVLTMRTYLLSTESQEAKGSGHKWIWVVCMYYLSIYSTAHHKYGLGSPSTLSSSLNCYGFAECGVERLLLPAGSGGKEAPYMFH